MSFALLTSPKPSISLFFQARPALDEIFRLDAANSAYYRLMCIGRFVLITYGLTKAFAYCYPLLFLAMNKSRFLAKEEYEGTIYTYVDRWQRALKVFVTLAARAASYEYFSRFCYQALDFQTPLSPLNLPGWTLRGLHYLCLKSFFRSPVEVMNQITEAVKRAPTAAISRSMLLDNTGEVRMWKYGYFLFQPMLTSFPTLARDTASSTGIGSTRTVTGASIERYRINAVDVTVSFMALNLVDFSFAIVSYGIIPFLRGKATAVGLEYRLINLIVKACTYLVSSAALTRIFGPTTTSVRLLGRETSMVTVNSVVSGVVVMFAAQFGTPYISKLVRNLRRRASGKSQEEIEAKAIVHAKKVFKVLVGREWSKMSEVEVVQIANFTQLILIEGLPENAVFQFGCAYLAALLEVLDRAAPCRDTLMMRALENGDLVRPNSGDVHDPIQTLRADSSVFAPEPSTIIDDDPCAVCLKQLKRESDDIVIGARCRHAYHTNCLRECLNLNAKCPLCNTELLTEPEGDKYTPPRIQNEHGPVALMRFGFDYNDSAKELLYHMLQMFPFMTGWDADLNMLTSYVQSLELSNHPVYHGLAQFISNVEPYYAARFQLYGQMLPPYTQLMDSPEPGEDGQPIQTFTSNAVWNLIFIVASVIKAQSLWGREEGE